MGKRLFIGNLPYSATDAELTDFFGAAGTVESAKVITEQHSGRSKGFGFVEMATDADAENAIAQLNGKDMNGRAIVVNEARPMAERRPRRFDNNEGGY